MALSLHSSPFYFLRAGHQPPLWKPAPRGRLSCYRISPATSEVIPRGKSLRPPGFEPRTPALQSTTLTMSLKS